MYQVHYDLNGGEEGARHLRRRICKGRQLYVKFKFFEKKWLWIVIFSFMIFMTHANISVVLNLFRSMAHWKHTGTILLIFGGILTNLHTILKFLKNFAPSKFKKTAISSLFIFFLQWHTYFKHVKTNRWFIKTLNLTRKSVSLAIARSRSPMGFMKASVIDFLDYFHNLLSFLTYFSFLIKSLTFKCYFKVLIAFILN